MNGKVKTSIVLFASALALGISSSNSTAKTMDLGTGIPKNLSDSVTRLKEVLPKNGKAVYRIVGWSESTMKQLCDQIDIYIAKEKLLK